MNRKTVKRRPKAKQLTLSGSAAVAYRHFKQGRMAEAEKLCWEQLSVNPEPHTLTYVLARVALDCGNNDAAIDLLEHIVSQAPRIGEYHFWLGEALCRADRYAEAIAYFENATGLIRDFAVAFNSLGVALEHERRTVEAIEAFKTALRHDPKLAAAHNNLGNAYQIVGNRQKAVACFRQAIKLSPETTQAHWSLAHVLNGEVEDDDITNMQACLADAQIDDADAVNLHFALGRALETRGDIDEAFNHFSSARRLMGKTVELDREGLDVMTNDIIAGYDMEQLRRASSYGRADVKPIFVLGMPRSGTTLVEQILAAHSGVRTIGERPFMEEVERSLHEAVTGPDPFRLDQLTAEQVRAAAETYLARSLADKEDTLTVDKTTYNFWRIGLIRTLFPSAFVIHCRRQPMDTCFSIFSQNFSDQHAYVNDLNDLGYYYRRYQRVMHHWHEQLPGVVFDIDYESMVSNPEDNIRAMLDFLALPFEEDCMRFHERAQSVRTASAWQVRQPIYNTSVGRAARYDTHLAELKRALGFEASIDG